MPLLKKESLQKTPIPENIKPDDEVFYCKTTNEVFTDYDKLFERVILCNSLVWTCSMTGKSGLTYQDAQASEEQARELLATFPEALNRPLLFLCSLTNRRSLNDLVDDLFGHVKDKYFVGETVEAFSEPGNIKKAYKVLKVMPASSTQKPSSPVKNGSLAKVAQPVLESDSFEYALQEICGQITSVRILKGSKLSRKKGKFTREKCKLFLKMNCEADPSQHVWKVKESSAKKYRISGMNYASIAPGPQPTFDATNSRKAEKESDNVIDLTSEDQNNTKQKKTSVNKDGSDPQKLQEARLKAQKDMQRVQEDLKNMRALAEEKKLKKIQEKEEQKKKAELEKAKKLEEKKKEKEMKKLQAVELNTPKEDLECDDLKDLPTAIPVHCSKLRMQCFGDLVFVKEFILAFRSILDLDVPKNFNLEKLLKALTSSDTNGHFRKILLSFVSSLLENSKEFEKQTNTEDGKVDQDSAEAVHSKASKQAVAEYGVSIDDLQLDQFTVSEVLRMYLKCLPTNHLVNDNFQNSESLVDELEGKSVFEMPAENKLQVLCILCHQLMSCNVIKMTIEENLDKLKVAQKNLKTHQTSCARREKDEIQYWTKKKQEQRLKNLLTGEAKTNSDDNPKSEDQNARKSNRIVQTIPDENFEKLPMDNIDWEKISDNEKQQMKMWEKRKEEGLVKEVSELLMGCPIVLGFDRTHRQYWKFTSLPGVFVEDYEDDVSGFKFLSPIKSRIMSPSRKKKEDEQKVTMDGKSNKENIPAEAKTFSQCKTITVQEQLASKGSTRWSFYNQAEQIDLLIQNLNVWGIRENQLLTNLKENYNSIVDGLKEMESVDKIFAQLVQGGNQECNNSSFSEEENEESEMEKNIAEYILDLEERIFAGALGKLKNVDRTKWRQALEEGNYNSSVFSCEGHQKKIVIALDGFSSALIQVERMVEDRFIDLLLGRKDKKSKRQQKRKEKEAEDSDDDASSTSSHVTRSASIDKWEENVRLATNLSQLFLLMSVVDNNITWSKSALNARCCVCRRKGDGENMLLCDGCDKGHHTYCLKPVVKIIPEGDWYCPKCRSERPKPKSAPKKVEVKIPGEDDETKDYDDFNEEFSTEEDSIDEDKKMTKQELLEKRFYSKVQTTSKAPTTTKSNNKKKTSLGNKRPKRKHEEEEEAEEHHIPEVKREKRKKYNDHQSGTTSVDMKMCEYLISDLMADENAWPFLRPVSKKDAPDYFDIIKTPMDFSTIRNKIHNFQYDRSEEMISDVRLIYKNCRTYNKQSSVFCLAADSLSEVFEKRLDELGSSTTNGGRDSKKHSIGSDAGNLRKKRARVVVDSDSDSETFQPRTLRKRTL